MKCIHLLFCMLINIHSLGINECDLGTHNCAQKCTDTLRSYLCDCNNGYELDADGYSCNSKYNFILQFYY